MGRKVLIIGGAIMFVIVGGAVVYGAQNNTTLPLRDTASVGIARAPSATTLDASEMDSSTATFHGVIDSQGDEVSYWFEYSADPLLGQILIRRTPRVVLITDSNAFSIEAEVRGLTNRTKYYVRLVVANGINIVRGNRIVFYTK